MAFEVCTPGKFRPTAALDESEGALSPKGSLTVRAEALEAIGAGAELVVLADAGSLRIALRRPRDGEGQLAVGVAVVKSGTRATDRRRITITAALRKLSLEPAAVAGRYQLTTHEDLLIVNLAGETSAARDGRGARRSGE